MVMDGDAGQNRLISYRTGAVQRFGLYVNNTAESGSNVGSDFAIRAYNDAGTLLNTPVFIKRSTGNVGIGTTAPTGKLEVAQTTGALDVIFSNTDATSATTIYEDNNLGKGIRVSSYGSTASGTLLDGTINRAGSVVIRTNDTSYPIVFGGISNSSEQYYFGKTAFTLALNTTTNNVTIGASSGTARLEIKGSGSTSATKALAVGNSAGTLALQVLDDSRVVLGNSSDFAVYSGSGITVRYAMSIGTTSLPTATLQVKGSGSTSATTSLLVQNSGATTSMIVRDDGNVGIGTTNPFALLTVGGQSSFYSVQSAGTGSEFFYSDINPNLTAGANNQIVSLLRLRDRGVSNTGGFTGTQRLSLLMENAGGSQYPFQLFSESGALRIGFTSVATPTALVHLKGTGSTAATIPLLIENSAGTQTFKVEDGGVVQIGLTSFITWSFNSNTLSCSQFAFILSSSGSILSTGGSGGVFGNDNGGKVADSGISTAQVASAVLEVSSTTRGFLPPRMTTAEKNLIATPANGLIVYDTTLARPCFFNGATWITL
jgi:hypothetical protein